MNEPPWLDAPLRTVAALVCDRLPHALLIQGPGGWGEERVANALAARLPDIDAGREMRAVVHPGLRWIDLSPWPSATRRCRPSPRPC